MAGWVAAGTRRRTNTAPPEPGRDPSAGLPGPRMAIAAISQLCDFLSRILAYRVVEEEATAPSLSARRHGPPLNDNPGAFNCRF